MDNIRLLLGATLMILGVVLITVAVFRSLKNQWTWGVHELWLLPSIGLLLLFAGRWFIQ